MPVVAKVVNLAVRLLPESKVAGKSQGILDISQLAALKGEFPNEPDLQAIDPIDYIAYCGAIQFRANIISGDFNNLRDLVRRPGTVISGLTMPTQIRNFVSTAEQVAGSIFTIYPNISLQPPLDAKGEQVTEVFHGHETGRACCDALYEGAESLGIVENTDVYYTYLAFVAENIKRLAREKSDASDSAID